MKKLYMILAAVAAMTCSAQAQTLQQGTIEVGDFNGATEFFGGSFFDCAPTTFYLAHTGVQMIYTVDELAAVQELSSIDITGLTFRMANENGFDEIVRDVKIYMQQIDESAFAVVEGVKQFFMFENLVGEYQETYPLYEFYGEDMELNFELATPFNLKAGKNLLVTMVFDALDDNNCTSSRFDAEFYTSGIASRSMLYTDNWTSFLEFAQGDVFPDATSMVGCGTNVDLPVTLIDYQYNGSTAINEVEAAATGDNAYYNLMGQKFTGNMPAGIYIHNGKKVVVK